MEGLYVCALVCVCVCVFERETERERETEKDTETETERDRKSEERKIRCRWVSPYCLGVAGSRDNKRHVCFPQSEWQSRLPGTLTVHQF